MPPETDVSHPLTRSCPWGHAGHQSCWPLLSPLFWGLAPLRPPPPVSSNSAPPLASAPSPRNLIALAEPPKPFLSSAAAHAFHSPQSFVNEEAIPTSPAAAPSKCLWGGALMLVEKCKFSRRSGDGMQESWIVASPSDSMHRKERSPWLQFLPTPLLVFSTAGHLYPRTALPEYHFLL